MPFFNAPERGERTDLGSRRLRGKKKEKREGRRSSKGNVHIAQKRRRKESCAGAYGRTICAWERGGKRGRVPVSVWLHGRRGDWGGVDIWSNLLPRGGEGGKGESR